LHESDATRKRGNIMSTTILSIESSCDETAAAIVVDGREVKSNIIYSQIELHKLYGGVVPEIASRKHVEKVNQVIRAAIEEAHVTWDDIDAVAVTYGPGLVGALLVGVSAAKAVAYAKKKPLVGVHHIEGHIAANYIGSGTSIYVHGSFRWTFPSGLCEGLYDV
jgi:N6-L-threonylcarbamoyladenine synthase